MVYSAYNFTLKPITEGEVEAKTQAASHMSPLVKSKERISTPSSLSIGFLFSYCLEHHA